MLGVLKESMRTHILLTAMLLVTVGCALNQYTSDKYNDWGGQAEQMGNYRLAETNYGKALLNAELGHSDAHISMAKYNLGRMRGYLCKFDEAERLLIEALNLEAKLSGPESGLTTMRLFELARLNFDRGRYEPSLQYYGRGIPIAMKLGVDGEDPIALADILDEFAVALAKSGRENEAAKARTDAKTLRDRNAGSRARFVPVRYNNACKSNP